MTHVIAIDTIRHHYEVEYKDQNDAMAMFFIYEEKLNRGQSIIIDTDGGYTLLNADNIVEINVKKKEEKA